MKQCAVLYVALNALTWCRRAIAWGLEHGLSREQLPFKVIRGPLDFRDPQVAADILATLEDVACDTAAKPVYSSSTRCLARCAAATKTARRTWAA